MGVAELKQAWGEGRARLEEDYREWDARRLAAIEAHVDALSLFLAGESDVAEFRGEIDSLGKAEPLWGFRGTSQMFFNQLVKAADPTALEAALRAVLPAPSDVESARTKLEAFATAVEEVRERAEKIGATLPGTGRVNAFVSFFWELQDREEWPIFFPNSRDVLEREGAASELLGEQGR